ncbi:MAG: hypothetical protein J6S67_00545 [Methanobrevibacter sp.]|nr:hypothetical protein [Methanobrevibacter sp.]
MLKRIWAFLKWINRQVTYRQRVEHKIDDIQRRVLRIEIDRAIERCDVKTVYELGDIYLGSGYNSYMSAMIADFKKKHPIKASSKKK